MAFGIKKAIRRKLIRARVERIRTRNEGREVREVQRQSLFEERKRQAANFGREIARRETAAKLKKAELRADQRRMARSFLGTLTRTAVANRKVVKRKVSKVKRKLKIAKPKLRRRKRK